MRVAFSGASGTGKSTLAKHVAEKFGVPVCPVGARSVAAEMGYASPYDVDAAGRRAEFQRRVFESKRAWEAEHEAFVTDRTVLDNLAYMICDGDPRSLRSGEVREYFEAHERYDLVVFTPVSAFQDLAGDPSRVQVAGYHEAYEAVLRGMIGEHGGEYAVLSIGDLRERLAYVAGWVRSIA